MATVLKIQTGATAYVEVPTPSKMKVTDELVWGSNTGRTQSGKMVGDFKGFKQKVECSWETLTASQMHLLRNTLHDAMNYNPFFKISYLDIENNPEGGLVEKVVYLNEIPRQLYSAVEGMRYYQDVQINFIEQ